MTPDVERAVEEVKRAHVGHHVEVVPEPQGGAYVRVDDLEIGEQYEPSRTWIGFLIPYLYPRADCYPHFMDGAVKRSNGQPLGVSFSGPVVWQERSAIQISRRSNRLNPLTDTAALKLAKVLEWIRLR